MIARFESPSGAERRATALAFLAALPCDGEALLVGASRGAVDELAHEHAAAHGAAFGLRRLTLTQLAALLAQPAFAAAGLAHATPLASLALAARATFDALAAGAIPYFAPVAGSPGFARSAAATLSELRGAGVAAATLAAGAAPLPELAALLAGYEEALAEAGLADRAALFATAARAPLPALPLLLFDVPLTSQAEAAFATALAAAAPQVLVTVPAGDETLRVWGEALASEPLAGVNAPGDQSSLARLRLHLFQPGNPPVAEPDESVRFFSAPGEGRETIEIARALLDEAAAGTPFDQMAVLLRTPAAYCPLLETAFRRAGIPGWFAPGTTRPDPAGRALLALLACAADGLSARRFAEYLAFAQAPAPGAAAPDWTAPSDDALTAALAAAPTAATNAPPDDGEGAVPAPWRWERLLVEAAVVGGAARWQRRLDGLDAELATRAARLAAEEPDAPRLAALAREREQLAHFKDFALPVITALAALPAAARWGEWLAHLTALAPRVLRRPQGALDVLAELAPMARVGPVGLDEVRAVLTDRLSVLAEETPPTRHGRVFVGALEQARGRSFAVVFVPGLAERIFPQRPREDPLLPDALRATLRAPAGVGLADQRTRGGRERLLLRLAAGAATRRLWLSYPRVDVVEARPRVTSFYGLDVARAVRGGIPDVEGLERAAEAAVRARLAWPAPVEAAAAIDDAEHDLATLGALLEPAAAATRRGAAQYLLQLNPHLARALRTRWMRWHRGPWTAYDGLVAPGAAGHAALAAHRLGAREYSVSALQHYAACPYRFYLSAVLRLAPRAAVTRPEQLDPLTRGRLFHRVQAATLRALAAAALLPLAQAQLDAAEGRLDAALDAEAAQLADALRPPIARVWDDAISALRADLRTWLRHLLAPGGSWTPQYVEFAFGLPGSADHDPASQPAAVTLPGGARLRGAIDLVERRTDGAAWRVTDHKTGANHTSPGMVIGGGTVLQPVLYALAVEAALGVPVAEARLFFCSSRGGFSERVVRIDDRARGAATALLATIDQALADGMLPPAPAADACTYCDFRPICGPYEAERMTRKTSPPLRALLALRAQP